MDNDFFIGCIGYSPANLHKNVRFLCKFERLKHSNSRMSRKAFQNKQYKSDNEKFLIEKAAEEGIVELSSGVLCRKLEQGRGTVCPGPSSIVYVNYTGRLIDGKVFDSTENESLPALFRVRELIMGWQIALTRMHEGDRWEIYVPAKWGIRSGENGRHSSQQHLGFRS
jgi:FKBP-type peptidyl-prolyl cis-trans isomerases 1